MLFRVCEHYNDEPIIQERNNECFICFEYKTDFENKPTNLQKQKLYLINCLCNGAVHNYCLKIWFDKHRSCPICRINVIENNEATIFIYQFIPWGIQIYSFAKKMSIRFVRILAVMLFFYALIDFCLLMFKIKYIPYNNYEYIPIPILEDEYLNENNKEYFN